MLGWRNVRANRLRKARERPWCRWSLAGRESGRSCWQALLALAPTTHLTSARGESSGCRVEAG